MKRKTWSLFSVFNLVWPLLSYGSPNGSLQASELQAQALRSENVAHDKNDSNNSSNSSSKLSEEGSFQGAVDDDKSGATKVDNSKQSSIIVASQGRTEASAENRQLSLEESIAQLKSTLSDLWKGYQDSTERRREAMERAMNQRQVIYEEQKNRQAFIEKEIEQREANLDRVKKQEEIVDESHKTSLILRKELVEKLSEEPDFSKEAANQEQSIQARLAERKKRLAARKEAEKSQLEGKEIKGTPPESKPLGATPDTESISERDKGAKSENVSSNESLGEDKGANTKNLSENNEGAGLGNAPSQ